MTTTLQLKLSGEKPTTTQTLNRSRLLILQGNHIRCFKKFILSLLMRIENIFFTFPNSIPSSPLRKLEHSQENLQRLSLLQSICHHLPLCSLTSCLLPQVKYPCSYLKSILPLCLRTHLLLLHCLRDSPSIISSIFHTVSLYKSNVISPKLKTFS